MRGGGGVQKNLPSGLISTDIHWQIFVALPVKYVYQFGHYTSICYACEKPKIFLNFLEGLENIDKQVALVTRYLHI